MVKKAGSKYICIEDYWFLEHKYHIKDSIYFLIGDIPPGNINFISCEGEGNGHCQFDDNEFKKHFISFQEYRKLKLKKINEQSI